MERNIRTLLGAFIISGLFCALLAAPPAAAASSGADAAKRVPTVEDLMALKSPGAARISPDGTRVAYTVTETDMEQDAYVTQIWLADVASGKSIQLTRGKKSSSGPGWSPDGRSLAFTSSRADDKSQIFVISPDGGEAVQLTKSETDGGDAWDVVSGVEHLVKKGWVDSARVGCMGWSQGGYISAFLTTSSRAFKAISVGAGISNWATYYYNTDITPFTINYPAADPAIYAKTSPMTYIIKAATPTLIQHGEFDKRVPIPNAYELRQGLEDRGVPVEMVVYKGYGHGITKPKSMRAVMEHNLAWFNHYIFGDPRPDLTAPPIPAKAEKKEGDK